MPKGVEHFWGSLRLGKRQGVPNSVMPKGVEHYDEAGRLIANSDVPNSVMPKGVEHSLPQGVCCDVWQCRIQ